MPTTRMRSFKSYSKIVTFFRHSSHSIRGMLVALASRGLSNRNLSLGSCCVAGSNGCGSCSDFSDMPRKTLIFFFSQTTKFQCRMLSVGRHNMRSRLSRYCIVFNLFPAAIYIV